MKIKSILKTTSRPEKWIKGLLIIEASLLMLGIIWGLVSVNNLAVALVGFIWMAIVPFAVANMVVSTYVIIKKRTGNLIAPFSFLVHIPIIVFLLQNVLW